MKPKYKLGDVVFFNNDSIYSKLILMYNRIVYYDKGWSHVGIITEINKDTVLIHEALSNGFNPNHYDKEYLEGRIEEGSVMIKRPKKKLEEVRFWADEYLGRPYAWWDIIGIGLSLFLKLPIGLTGAKKLICSEAVARVLYDCSNKKINFEEEFNKRYDYITPTDLAVSKQLK